MNKRTYPHRAGRRKADSNSSMEHNLFNLAYPEPLSTLPAWVSPTPSINPRTPDDPLSFNNQSVEHGLMWSDRYYGPSSDGWRDLWKTTQQGQQNLQHQSIGFGAHNPFASFSRSDSVPVLGNRSNLDNGARNQPLHAPEVEDTSASFPVTGGFFSWNTDRPMTSKVTQPAGLSPSVPMKLVQGGDSFPDRQGGSVPAENVMSNKLYSAYRTSDIGPREAKKRPAEGFAIPTQEKHHDTIQTQRSPSPDTSAKSKSSVTCQLCRKVLKGQHANGNMKRHQNSDACGRLKERKKYPCKMCDKVYNRSDGLLNHRRNKHSAPAASNVEPFRGPKRLRPHRLVLEGSQV
ncbi:uncharacterized protein BDR25DRAFT_92880 [Lindgomyces ingoldianus]|uniref:Uncharacterized protein n=1 Tax=Lindgomyces ingoldianus TaxID=673940 RepID=A0ACB6QDV9_9PLEO|nr:uncharacterized protein BDR25DRAFT_92880 [Lindgomyces ingoldianus]KAF2465077.1 hypothetical protein BDR25DRAFT_92880 [Lindgomyces ingoldianus]